VSDCEDDMTKDNTARDGHKDISEGEISESEINEARDHFFNQHIRPSRLFGIAMELTRPEWQDMDHLVRCEKCRGVFDRYRSVVPREGDFGSTPSAATECEIEPNASCALGVAQESTPSPDLSLARPAKAVDPASRTSKRERRYVFSAVIVVALLLAMAAAVLGAQVVKARRTAIASIWRLTSDTERDRTLLTSETARLQRQLKELETALQTLTTAKQAQKVRFDDMLRTANSDDQRLAKLAALLREGDASEIDEKLQLWKDFKSQDDFSGWKRQVELASARAPNWPVGTILACAGEVPAAWHVCDGTFVNDKTGRLTAALKGGAVKPGRDELVQLPNLLPNFRGCLASVGSPDKNERNLVARAKMRGASVAKHSQNVESKAGSPTEYSVDPLDGCYPAGWADAPAPPPEQKPEELNEAKPAAQAQPQPKQLVLGPQGSNEPKLNSGKGSAPSNTAIRWIIKIE
jgi:hypothetical protein